MVICTCNRADDCLATPDTLLRCFIREGRAARRAYQDAMPELTSRENWARLYQI